MPSKFLNLSTDDTLGGNSPSDAVAVSQKAIKKYVDDHSGGGGSVSIDGITITKNASDELQAIGLINKNTAAGATNPKYDWIGTLAEYTSQNIETLHPDWVCYITDDISGGVDVYTKAEVDTLLAGKYSTSNPSGYQTSSDVTTSINAINALEKIPNYTLTFASTVNLATNTSYILTLGGDVTFVLPNPEAGKLNQIEVQVYMATAYTIGLGTSYFFGGESPDMSEAGYYSIMYEYDWLQQQWIVGALKKGAAA